jgi:CheY-like chemotaxis protein
MSYWLSDRPTIEMELPPQPETPQHVLTAIIADDDSALVQVLTIRLKRLGFTVFRSPDAMHALLGAHRLRPELLIVDIHMPGGNGLSVSEMIYSDPHLANIAVIVMSGDGNDAVVRHCHDLGAEFVRKGAQLWSELEQAIRRRVPLPSETVAETAPVDSSAAPTPESSDAAEDAGVPTVLDSDLPPATQSDAPVEPVVERSTTARTKILTIDDDPDVTYMIKLRLERLGLEVLEAATGMQGFWKAVECRPQVIICDLNMPDGEGSYVFGRLTSHPVTKDIPVIILTGLSNPALRRHMLGLGVAGFLQKPVVFEDLITELRKHISLGSATTAAPISEMVR